MAQFFSFPDADAPSNSPRSSPSSPMRMASSSSPPPSPVQASSPNSTSAETSPNLGSAPSSFVDASDNPDENSTTGTAAPALDTQPVTSRRRCGSSSSEWPPRKRFLLHRELCQSIFGKVFVATDRVTRRFVAVKVSVRRLMDHHTSLAGKRVLECPVAEAKLMEQCSGHPNVVSLVGSFLDDDLHWLVQEYLAGGDLFDAMSATPLHHFDERTARIILRQVISGLQHIHSCGVAHLDVSLENVLLETPPASSPSPSRQIDWDQTTVKLCDFGLARAIPPSGKFRASNVNDGRGCTIHPGKIGYMAPEIYAGESFDGFRADVFSCGVLLFHMLTGHPPFLCADRSRDIRYDLIAQGKLTELVSRMEMGACMRSEACDLVSKLLVQDPERRPTLEQVLKHPWMAEAPPPTQHAEVAAAPSDSLSVFHDRQLS